MQRIKYYTRHHRKKVYAGFLLMAYLLMSVVFQHYITIYSHVFRGIKYLTSPRWEVSIQGTHEDCMDVFSVIKNEDINNAHQFSDQKLSHPSFLKLLYQQLDRQGLSLEILCKRSQKTNKLFDLTRPLSDISVTSASKSYFYVKNKSVSMGGTIEVFIVTRDRNGGDTTHAGGDFFKVTAETQSMGASIAASDITYMGKGVYIAKIQTQWAGPHDIKVMFGNSGHFVGLVAGVTSTQDSPTMVLNAEYTFGGTRKQSRCGIVPMAANKFLCNHTNHNGEKWYCAKPDLLSCKDIESIYVTRKTTVLELLQIFPLEDR